MTVTPSRDVIDELIDDHEEARDLLTQIHVTAEPDRRRELADVLIAGLVRHSVAEETVTYPVFRKYLPNGDEIVEHDIEEHKELELALRDLESSDPANGDFDSCVARVQKVLLHHVEGEEEHQFPELRAVVPPEQLESMAGKVDAIKRVAPTRPHPSAPNSPLFHVVAGPGVGLVDRLKDRLSDRPTTTEDLT